MSGATLTIGAVAPVTEPGSPAASGNPLEPLTRPAATGLKSPRAERPAYAEAATLYDQRTGRNQKWRRQLIDLLPLRPGDVVVDAGCGTGLCFPRLMAKIGPVGAIVGIDESPHMVAIARERAHDNAWNNVTLITAPVERADISVTADAALFCAVHEILQSPAAVANVLGHLRPGAWVAAGGGKWAAPRMLPLNWYTFTLHEPYVTDFHGFDRPWRLLEHVLDDFQVTDVAFGTGYLALGRTPTRPRSVTFGP